MSRGRVAEGAALFEDWYSGLFGPRWPALRAALLEPVSHVPLSEGLRKPYYLDAGSLEAAAALPPPPPGGKVLDMCAAPGGKTLALALALAGVSGTAGLSGDASVPTDKASSPASIVANEYSRERRARLVSVLDEHLDDALRPLVAVTGYDASRWSRYEKSAYDRILLDAPCSSERHVLSSPAYLSEWTPARVRNLAQRQWSLLSGAWLVLANGGYLVYSTCALSPKENDDVVEKLMRKYPDAETVEPGLETKGEKTRYGTHVLPDTAGGSGPLYYALVRKRD